MKKNVRKVYQRLCCLLLCLALLFGASLSGHAYTYIPPDPDEPVMGVSRIVGLTPASMTDEGKKMLEQADSAFQHISFHILSQGEGYFLRSPVFLRARRLSG